MAKQGAEYFFINIYKIFAQFSNWNIQYLSTTQQKFLGIVLCMFVYMLSVYVRCLGGVKHHGGVGRGMFGCVVVRYSCAMNE